MPLASLDPLGLSRIVNSASVVLYIKDEENHIPPVLLQLAPGQEASFDGVYQGPPGTPQFEDATVGTVVRKFNNKADITVEDSCAPDDPGNKTLTWKHNNKTSSAADKADITIWVPIKGYIHEGTGWWDTGFLARHVDWPQPPAAVPSPSPSPGP